MINSTILGTHFSFLETTTLATCSIPLLQAKDNEFCPYCGSPMTNQLCPQAEIGHCEHAAHITPPPPKSMADLVNEDIAQLDKVMKQVQEQMQQLRKIKEYCMEGEHPALLELFRSESHGGPYAMDPYREMSEYLKEQGKIPEDDSFFYHHLNDSDSVERLIEYGLSLELAKKQLPIFQRKFDDRLCHHMR